jgi:hypothetical protein
MKSLVFQTDATTYELGLQEQHKLVTGPRGLEVRTRVVLIVPRRTLTSMLTEVDDGTQEDDIREAIKAASLADNWTLASEIAQRYGLVVCLACAADVGQRPTWRLHRLMRELRDLDNQPAFAADWGEICGSCAVQLKEQYSG